MIPTNLKIGDTFVDGGTYEVTAVFNLGGEVKYEAKRIVLLDTSGALKTAEGVKPSIPTPKEEKAVTEDVDKAQLDSFNKYTKTEINRLNNTELEAVCDKLGLEKSTGVAMKKAIIDHLGL